MPPKKRIPEIIDDETFSVSELSSKERRERAVRPIGKAEDLFKIKPSSTQELVSGSSDREEKLAKYDRLIERLKGRGQRRGSRLRMFRSLLVPVEGSGFRLRRSRQPAAGPPWLFGVPLYDWRYEGLHEVFEGFAIQLDEATDVRVVFSYVGNPKQTGPWYEILRSPELADQDVESAKAYFEMIQEGRGADYERRRQVGALVAMLGIKPEQLPCIAFLASPPTQPAGLLSIKPEWVTTRSRQVVFATALEEFFDSQLNLNDLTRDCPTNRTLMKRFMKRISTWFEGHQSGLPAAAESEIEQVADEYCRIFTNEGLRVLRRDEYEELITTKKRYNLFIDGFTRYTWRRLTRRSKFTQDKLTPAEFEMIQEYIRAKAPLRPLNAKVMNHQFLQAPVKLFESARRKVDINVDGKFKAFHVIEAVGKDRNSYEFRPPDGMTFCLILPKGFSEPE